MEEDKGRQFLTKEILSNERNVYIGSVILTSIGYLVITLWLNSIRTNAPIALVWVLIGIQLLLYFLIFSISYGRAKVMGLKFAFPVFVGLAVLGRVNDWEIIVIPLMIVVMAVWSFKNKKISDKMKRTMQW